ncbi:hypothetical protein H6P81_014041 [Aristolochia fimbriata]|uniref:Methyltransferase type 11 domain-containing protein n=1 Tax=Aristolochia fimbriata TaxID=158543 RepID=A0AAV7EGL5_ARIFI|nr:hypothetical protein H6P81_014041 [Aristolochia fimbriata]
MSEKPRDAELLATLGDFTRKENWDKFFTLRGSDEPFEWYVEWSNLERPLISELSQDTSLQILIPGCGNSSISECLYDMGFKCITNIDFSKVVVSDMLRKHIRSRPEMRWRVMDMTNMQFTDGFFDVVLDKGGLDALMEPEHGTKLGNQYLSEVRRILKSGGKYVCLTLAESHVLGLLFSKFRFGWKTNIHAIPLQSTSEASFQTFMVVISKENSPLPTPIELSFDLFNLGRNGQQGCGLLQAFEAENNTRSDYSSGADIVFSFEDLQLGAKGDLKEVVPGRRAQLTLGDDDSCYSYKAVLLDSKKQSDPFRYHFGAFLVPGTRVHEWLFSSEEGQWLIVESLQAARLIMVLLDARHSVTSMDEIQKDLSPLVKKLAPSDLDDGAQIPFLMANDGIRQRNIIKQVTSPTTGQITVEDVIYEKTDNSDSRSLMSKDDIFRRLTFQRSLGLIQSEALLTEEELHEKMPETTKKRSGSSSKYRRKGSQKKSDTDRSQLDASRNHLKVDHSFLASSYHTGIISGLALMASDLESAASQGKGIRMVLIGLGAGLLPMFLRKCMPLLEIDVVELDPVVLDISREYFGFKEDEKLQVHIADGIQYVRGVESNVLSKSLTNLEDGDESSKSSLPPPLESGTSSVVDANESNGIDLLIIDADSADMSSGLTCPPAAFTEESFLLSAKNSLCKGGLFVINLVSRSQSITGTVVSRMKAVFNHLFSLELEEDVNMVLFALPAEACSLEDSIPKMAVELEKLILLSNPEARVNVGEIAGMIKRIK